MPPSPHASAGARPALYCATGIAALLLASCTTLTVSGLLAASHLSPLTADPAAVGAAVSVPAGVALRDGDAQLLFGYTPDTPGAEPFVEHFRLEIEPLEALAGADARDSVFAARIGPDDEARFRRAQERIRHLRASGDGGRGTLSIMVSGGCYTGRPPARLPVSTWLRTRPEGDYVQLTRRRDLLALGADAVALRDALEVCDGSKAAARERE